LVYEINASNDAAFGLKQNAFSAGWYEFLIIVNIAGNQITFSTDMVHNYDAGGQVQLIHVPGFDNVNVSGTLTCDPWDPSSGTGGVVAMIIGNTLTLEADIDVSNKGFLGGSSVIRPSGTCSGATDYFFNDASTEGGYKGEGAASYGFEIGGLPLGTDYIKGRGAYFNGGGGGIIWHSGVSFPAEVSASILKGSALTESCAAMLPEAGSQGVVTNDLFVPISGFLLNSIYSNKTGKTIVTICEGDDTPILVGTQPLGGTSPYSFKWESSTDGINWNFADGINDQQHYNLGPLESTTYFRRVVIDNSIPQIIDISKSIRVDVGATKATNLKLTQSL